MKKLAIRLALLAYLLLPFTVSAQEPLHLSSVVVDVWPEYDRQAVLVIERFSLVSDTRLPVSLTTHIPTGVQINAIAANDPARGLINAPYESSTQGSKSELKITSISLKVQVEYYESLNKDGVTRHIIYEWPADNIVDTLDINFLLPPAADNVKISPSPASTSPEQGGSTNYLIRATNPPTGQPFIVTIDYDRYTDDLGIASLPVEAVSTPGVSTPGRAFTPFPLPWVLGGVGFLLVLVSGVGIYRRRRDLRASRGKRVRISRQAKEQDIYCSQCGKRAQPGDTFCRTCGARLKQGTKA